MKIKVLVLVLLAGASTVFSQTYQLQHTGAELDSLLDQVEGSRTDSSTSGYNQYLIAINDTVIKSVPGAFNVEAFGADGVGDDASYIQAAADAAYAAGGTVHGAGTFTIGSTVVLRSNADFTNAIFQTTDTTITAIVWGDTNQIIQNKTVRFPEVIQNTHTAGEWPVNINCVGIKIINGYGCNFYVPYIKNFTNGLLVTTSGAHGSVYSTYFLGQLISNKINLRLAPAANGWTNSNLFQGGSSLHAVADGTTVPGVIQVLLDSTGAVVDGNTFHSIAFESDAAEYVVNLRGARTNMFRDCRWESTAKTVLQQTGAAEAMPFNNFFSGGVNLADVVFQGVQWYPTIIDNGNTSHYRGGYLTKTAVVASNYSSDNYPAFAVVADEDSLMPSNNNYHYDRAGWRVSQNKSEFKAKTDSAARMIISHTTGDVTWGPGGTSALDVTLSRSGVGLLKLDGTLRGGIPVEPSWTLDSTALATYGTRFDRTWFKTGADSVVVDSLCAVSYGRAAGDTVTVRVLWGASRATASDSLADLKCYHAAGGVAAASTKVIPPSNFVWVKITEEDGAAPEIQFNMRGRKKSP